MRKVPINSDLVSLHEHLKKEGELGQYVLLNLRTGKPHTRVDRSFKTACKKAKLHDLRFHDLRHTFASRLVENGVDLITVKELLGHSTFKVTERYTHPNQDQKKMAVESLTKKPLVGVDNPGILSHHWHTEEGKKKSMPVTSLFSVN